MNDVMPDTDVKLDVENPLGKSRIGVTKKIYRPVAQKKARKLAKKMRKMNRRRN